MTGRLDESTIAIVGVGLLGGSIGLALEGRVERRIGVIGPGDDAAAARRAVDEVVSLEAAVAAADVVVLATPVRTIVEFVPRVTLLAREGALMTDVGSTKQEIVAAMTYAARERPDLAIAGGHPMRGGVAAGVDHASPDLFDGADWLLCPVAGASDDSIARASQLVRATGAEPRIIACDEHDPAVALVSHVPYVLATALVERLEKLPLAQVIASAGWQRITAGAGGDEAMWQDILATNAGPIADELDELAATLAARAAELRAGELRAGS
jgi:prephenate dehydrogenase